MRYNDYEKVVRGYLQNYKRFKARMPNIEKECIDITRQIQSLIVVPIAKYGNSGSGGYNELNSNEMTVFKKEKLEDKLEYLKSEYMNISSLINRLDSALALLPDDSRTIIELHYIQGRSWKSTADEVHYDISTCHRKRNKALTEIAKSLFWKDMKDVPGVLFVNPE